MVLVEIKVVFEVINICGIDYIEVNFGEVEEGNEVIFNNNLNVIYEYVRLENGCINLVV